MAPATPATNYLQRSTSTPFASPGGSYAYRSTEDESIILDIGARYLRGGFSGESLPRCTLTFHPNEHRRVGDYRQYMPDYEFREKRDTGAWGADHELWRMDLRGLDVGLVKDKLERTLRKAYNEYFLIDKPRKVLLAVAPGLPRALLETVLGVLFVVFQSPSVTLMSGAMLATVSAGLRSGLVVDLGWAETRVTAVYEYREIGVRRSVRAGRMLGKEMGKLVERRRKKSSAAKETDGASRVTFEQAEEVLERMGWCMSIEEARKLASNKDDTTTSSDDTIINVPLSGTNPPEVLNIPFSQFSNPIETTLFSTDTTPHELDAHDQPLHQLIYNALLSLPVAPRDICMARIIFTGGCAKIPGLKPRLTQEVAALVQQRGWDLVKNYGAASKFAGKENGNGNGSASSNTTADETLSENDGSQSKSSTPAQDQTPTSKAGLSAETDNSSKALPDRPHATLTKESERESIAERRELVRGVVRGVESLGPWAGGCLVAALRMSGKLEVEREKFLKDGLGNGNGYWL